MVSVTVDEYYAGKNIFITGATGFMGKVIVEKLLRSCPRVGKIYMLLRQKHGKSIGDRLNNFLGCPIYDILRKNSPEALDKLKVVTGDITTEGLGLSDDDRNEVLTQCNIVFHCAACVRFDLPLRQALYQNTRATKWVFELAERIKHLEVFVHMSTSYCQHENMVLEEKLYPTAHSPQRIMELVDWMDDDMIADIQAKIIHPHGNTYSYTKALSETVVSQYAGKFPIAIARPSIVVASLKEPMPGWIDNLNGPTGFMVAAGKGVLRSVVCRDEIVKDFIPVDLAVNACILLAYHTALERPQDIRVCNITQSGANALSWGDTIQIFKNHITNGYPFSRFLWIPGGSVTKSRIHHNVAAFFKHLLVAYFIDLFLFLLGRKGFMINTYYRVKQGTEVLEYYITTEWKFTNNYFRSLTNKISMVDKNKFYTDMEMLDWESYVKNYLLGVQRYILKEDPADRPRAKRLLNIVWCVDKILVIVYYCLLFFMAYKIK